MVTTGYVVGLLILILILGIVRNEYRFKKSGSICHNCTSCRMTTPFSSTYFCSIKREFKNYNKKIVVNCNHKNI